MDTFVEQIVKQKLSGKQILLIVATVLAAIALIAVVFLYLPYILLFAIAFGGFGIWWVASSQSCEVEYSVTNGDIDIDLIVARRKRKRIVQVRGEKIESLLPVMSQTLQKHYDRVVMAAQTKQSATWCFTYHSKKSGSTLVLFEPNERVLNALKNGLPRIIQIETDRALRG